MDAFRQHPGISSPNTSPRRRIGWQPKVESLAAIAEELGFDNRALVFVDDSAHECESIRQQLPEIAVINLPSDPTFYVAAFATCEA